MVRVRVGVQFCKYMFYLKMFQTLNEINAFLLREYQIQL